MTQCDSTQTGSDGQNTRRQFIGRATRLGALTLPLLAGWPGTNVNLACSPKDLPLVFPVSPHSPPSGFPTPDTTGLSNESLLSPREGDGTSKITFSKNNAVVENRDFYGSIYVTGKNVTFRNCRMVTAPNLPRTGNAIRALPEATGILLEDCYIHGTSINTEIVVKLQGGGILRRCDIGGGQDHIRAHRDMIVKDCYLKTHFDDPHGEPHNDGIQLAGGANFVFENNTVIAPYQSQTSAFIIKADTADITNVLVKGNYCSGGAFTIYTHVNSARPWVLRNVVVRDNIIEINSGKYGDIWNNTNAVYVHNRLYDPVSQTYQRLADIGG